MIITDEPMPGVQPVGSSLLCAIAVKGETQTLLSLYFRDEDVARKFIRSMIWEYDEIILIEGKTIDRVWRKDSANAQRCLYETQRNMRLAGELAP